MKSNTLINCLVWFYNVSTFSLNILIFIILLTDLHTYFKIFATEPNLVNYGINFSNFFLQLTEKEHSHI